MSWMTTIATYGAAYMFLSLCVALVIGRLFRVMGPSLELDTPEMMEAVSWDAHNYRTGPSGQMEGAVAG